MSNEAVFRGWSGFRLLDFNQLFKSEFLKFWGIFSVFSLSDFTKVKIGENTVVCSIILNCNF